MLQHFVEFSKDTETEGLYGTIHIKGKEVSVLPARNMEEVRLVIPKEAFAFQFFDQNVHICEDGEVIRGQRKNFSGIYYYGKGPYTEEELLEEYGDRYQKDIEVIQETHIARELEKQWKETMRDSEVEIKDPPKLYVVTENGELYPIYPEDAVLSPLKD